MRHVVVTAGTGAIGLIAVFAVDLINLFYISRFGLLAIAVAGRLTARLMQQREIAPVLDAPVTAGSAHSATAALVTPLGTSEKH